jgi:hypothetical protein
VRNRGVRALEVLSISALDLFASALGVFILMAVVLFPFYLKAPSVEAALDGARQELADTRSTLDQTRSRVADAAELRRAAEARLAGAEADLEAATEDLAAAEKLAAARTVRPTPQPRRSAPQSKTFAIGDLDLVFVMDTTGSMRNEIADIQRSLLSIIRVLQRMAPSLRVGFVAFKDRTDEYVTLVFPLSPMDGPNLQRIQGFVRNLSARGGGDPPEPVDQAIHAALQMAWRPDAIGRIVVIGDAAAHQPNWGRAFDLAAGFRRSGGRDRRVSGIFTGRARVSAEFYQRLAQAGGGELISHRGRIMESVLLSILDGAR